MNMNKTPMGKTADAFRKFGWALVAAGSFSITAAPYEKHLTHGVVIYRVTPSGFPISCLYHQLTSDLDLQRNIMQFSQFLMSQRRSEIRVERAYETGDFSPYQIIQTTV